MTFKGKTWRGYSIEGLLPNSRMANGIFDDETDSTRYRWVYPDTKKWDADRNTREFVENMSLWRNNGLLAFTICLQGGSPLGYTREQPWKNSALNEKGELKPDYTNRLAWILDKADELGMVVILGIFYVAQEKSIVDESAVLNGIRNTVEWIIGNGYTNVLIEINNECDHGRWTKHSILKDDRVHEAILYAKNMEINGRRLLVGTSYGGGAIPGADVVKVSDFILLHGNNVNNPERIIEMVKKTRKIEGYTPKPILFNEDDHFDFDKSMNNFVAATSVGASWGYFDYRKLDEPFESGYQSVPVDWSINYERKKAFFNLLNQWECVNGEDVQKIYFPSPDAQGGWRTLDNSAEVLRITGIDTRKLDEAFEFIKKDTKHGGLLVVRDGWLVYEKYFGKGHRNATTNLASCAKPFTSIAMGVLMSERPDLFPDGLEQKVFRPEYLPAEVFPLTDPAMADIKLGQLLAFTAGIRGNNPVYVNGRKEFIDPVGPDGWQSCVDSIAFGKEEYELNGKAYSGATLWCKPGTGYSYATSSIHIVSVIIRHITGLELQEYIQQRLAEPMGWEKLGYAYRNSGLVHTPGGGGIVLKPTDMLRFGYLLINKGRWGDRQLVPGEYVEHCSKKSPYNPHFPYSLQFDVNTDRNVETLPSDAFWKSGSGGHCIYVAPSLDLIVWKLGGRDDQYSAANTGFPESSDQMEKADDRKDWVRTIDVYDVFSETLKMVIDAVVHSD